MATPIDWDAMDRAPWCHRCKNCGTTYGQHKHRDLQCPRIPRGRWPWQWWGPSVFDWDNSTPVEYRKLAIVDDRPKDYVDPRLRAEADLLITLPQDIEKIHRASISEISVGYKERRSLEATAVPTMNEYGATHKLRQDADSEVFCVNCHNDEMWCLNNFCPEQP